LPKLEAKRPELVGINAKWPKKGAWAAIGPNIWDVENSHKMLDQAVEQLTLYLKVFGPIIKAYVKRNRLGSAGKPKPRQVEVESREEAMDAEVPYPPEEVIAVPMPPDVPVDVSDQSAGDNAVITAH
jgi:hypothetical protein